jgi:hypothetical protein
MAPKAAADDDPVSACSRLEDLCLDIGENLQRFLPPSPNTGMAPVGVAALNRNLIGKELDIGILRSHVGAEVPAIEGVISAPYVLDVLLRHRPRSISRLCDYRSSSL